MFRLILTFLAFGLLFRLANIPFRKYVNKQKITDYFSCEHVEQSRLSIVRGLLFFNFICGLLSILILFFFHYIIFEQKHEIFRFLHRLAFHNTVLIAVLSFTLGGFTVDCFIWAAAAIKERKRIAEVVRKECARLKEEDDDADDDLTEGGSHA